MLNTSCGNGVLSSLAVAFLAGVKLLSDATSDTVWNIIAAAEWETERDNEAMFKNIKG